MPAIRAVVCASFLALALGGCQGATDRGSVPARLAEIGVDPADVAEVEYTTDRAAQGGILDRWGWARMKSCNGYIVVRTSGGYGRSGSQPYATGNCRVPEPKS